MSALRPGTDIGGRQSNAIGVSQPPMLNMPHHRLGPMPGESLVKMDHFQKEPPPNSKGTTGAQGGSKGARTTILKEQIGNPAQTECPLWVKSRHLRLLALAGVEKSAATH
jgi:hypothetical protein